MYAMHIVSHWLPSADNLDLLGLVEVDDPRLWNGASPGDFVLLGNTNNTERYLTRVAYVHNRTDNDEPHRVILEQPIRVSGGPEIGRMGYIKAWNTNGEGFQSADDLIESLGIQIRDESNRNRWLWSEDGYRPLSAPPSTDKSSRDPEDPDNNGGDGDGNGNNDGDEGGEGGDEIDRTGTMLSEQYSARDAIRQAAKGTTQATILLFGVVLAGLALFEDAIRDVDMWWDLAPVWLGVLLLLGALLGSAFVLVRTAAFPRPSSSTLSTQHEKANKAIYSGDGSGQPTNGDVGALRELSSSYFAEITTVRKRNALLGRLIGLTVGLATGGTILVFYGALVLGTDVSIITSSLRNRWILADTVLALAILSIIVGGIMHFALNQSDLKWVGKLSRAPERLDLTNTTQEYSDDPKSE